jgi:Tol biopolymer transport system component
MVAAPSAHGAFPGANGKIAFVRDDQIWVMNANGSDPIQLTSVDGSARTPAWSANGRLIAFVMVCCGPGAGTSLHYMNGDGSNVNQIGGGFDGFDPSWSPDNRHLALSTSDGFFFPPSNPNIFTLAIDAPRGDRVTSPPNDAYDFAPAWSPPGVGRGVANAGDGSLIVFERAQNGGSKLRTVLPNGLALQQVNDSLPYESDPNWSPDGKRIVFRGGSSTSTGIYIVNADGTELTPVPNTDRDYRPAWSPDGTKLVVWHFPDPQPFGPTEIDLVDPVTGTHTSLTSGHHDSDPDWQPIPNRPPDCSHVTATPGTLSPPDHKLVSVSVAGATDPDGDQVTLTITGVTQDEPRTSSPDATLGPAANQVSLRAERDGGGDGRVYRIALTASDGKGGSCSGVATVGVPHNGGTSAVDSAPPSYDSLVR